MDITPTFYLGGQAYEVSEEVPAELGEQVITETVAQYIRLNVMYHAGVVVPEEGRPLSKSEWNQRGTEMMLGLTILSVQLQPFLPHTRRILKSLGVVIGGLYGVILTTDFE